MSATSAIERLASFTATHPRGESTDHHLQRASEAFLDTIGCMILGRDAAVTRTAIAACRSWGDGPAPVPGTGVQLPPPWAALAGGAAAHSFDLDDYTLIANDHPSAVLVPALLAQAAATPTNLTGVDILEAYLIGLEVIFRVGAAVNMGHYNQGWHTTCTIDSLGATAAIARLKGLSTKQAASALSLTTSLGSGFVSQFGTMAKPLHAGISAKAGITSCALASAGATASPHVLDGPVSLATVMSPSDVPGFAEALQGLGQTWGLDRFGLGAKLYPSCGYTHRCIDGALELRERLGAPATEEVASIALSLPDFHLAILPYDVPETPEEALFSAPWCAAVAFATGQCTSADFTPLGLARADIRALTARTKASARSPLDPNVNVDPADPDTVVVTMSSGQRHLAKVDLWTGAPGRDLGRDRLVDKFRQNCTETGIEASEIEALVLQILELPKARSTSDLIKALSNIRPST